MALREICDSLIAVGKKTRRPSPPSTRRGSAAGARRAITAGYAQADDRRALLQLLNTGLPFAALLAAMTWLLHQGISCALLLALPTAGLLIRLFMIQHDCGHGSFLRARWANAMVGRAIGVLTLTPYYYWRHAHNEHHANSGNLDRRGDGAIITFTLREYLSLSPWRRLAYRTYRHPLVLFGIGPAYQFLLRHRIPTGHPLRAWRIWLSIVGTDIALATIATAALMFGLNALLIAYLPVMLLAASLGVWLFHVQHQFEDTYWEAGPRWSFHTAAIEGSSFYDLPRVLQWCTANIGLHHIHHLASRIPNYRLRECFERNPELQGAKRLTLRQSLGCVWLSLWDEENRKLVPFSRVKGATWSTTRPIDLKGKDIIDFASGTDPPQKKSCCSS